MSTRPLRASGAPILYRAVAQCPPILWGSTANKSTASESERVLFEFIPENRDRLFFVYMPQAMPGSTRAPFASERFRGKSANGPWGDSVEELDWSAGEILAALKRLDLDERTLAT